MKNIIVPIDFSNTAKNALRFAEDMTADLYSENTQIKVANVYNGLLNTQKPLVFKPNEPIEDSVTKEIQYFIDFEEDTSERKRLAKKDLKIIPYPLFGTPVNKLERVSKSPDTELIVMGTAGENKINIERRIFGSIASEVSLKSHSPVLLIPPRVSYGGFNKIMIASDNLVPTESHLRTLNELTKNNKALYHFVHVKNDKKEETIDAEKVISTIAVKAGIPEDKSKVKIVEMTNAGFGISSYAETNDIDLLVVTTEHRNFWREMLHSSNTQALILHASLPILVLHAPQKKMA